MNSEDYRDIIALPHHVSATRAHMPVADRAAQFAPFAALTGYNAAIRETARLTDEKAELDETEKAALDERLRYLQDQAAQMPVAVFTYFEPDKRKSGGTYISHIGTLKKIDAYTQNILLTDGTIFPIDCLFRIEGEPFSEEKWL